MNTYLKQNLRAMWLMTAALSLVLPIFLPSSAHSSGIMSNVIGSATVTMFILSFPASLLGLPVVFFGDGMFEFEQASIGGMYLNLWIFFLLGVLQWFVIVPRVWRGNRNVQELGLPKTESEILLTEASVSNMADFCRRDPRTPLERVIRAHAQDRAPR